MSDGASVKEIAHKVLTSTSPLPSPITPVSTVPFEAEVLPPTSPLVKAATEHPLQSEFTFEWPI
jgi:hypothetical protein